MARQRVRLGAVQAAFALGLAALVARAAQVQLIDGPEHAERALGDRTERVERMAPRGEILDRRGVQLASNQVAYHVDLTPGELLDRNEAANTIAEHLDLPLRLVRERFRRRNAYFHGPFTSIQVQSVRDLRGVYLEDVNRRFYPNGSLARSLLGAPAEDGRPASGIERSMDSVLTGREGSAVVLRDQFGRQYESPARLDAFPVAGHDVWLTIDADLQDLVERALANAVSQLQATGGDILVMEPQTGEILAVASMRADGSAPARAFNSVFEPGSTAKLFAAAALLRAGVVHADDSVWGEGGMMEMENRTIRDTKDEGWMRLRDVITRSSNIGITKFVQRLTPAQQYEALRDFGLGAPTGISFPAESEGLMARRPDRWSATSSASLAMGYEIAVTILQLAQAYSAVANGGVMMQPALVSRVVSPDGKERYAHRPTAVRRVVSKDAAAELRAMLHDVVYNGGTGEAAALIGYEVAGKTGTARRAEAGRYIPDSHTTTFASMFPADDPQLVMVVKLDDPDGVYARYSAAPLTRSMLEQILAGRTTVINRDRLGGRTSTPRPRVSSTTGVAPYVVNWPPEKSVAPSDSQVVPDVRGQSLRLAARAVHDRGLLVRLDGWGTVASIRPAPGTRVPRGTKVTLTAENLPRD